VRACVATRRFTRARWEEVVGAAAVVRRRGGVGRAVVRASRCLVSREKIRINEFLYACRVLEYMDFFYTKIRMLWDSFYN
jgi:hypothetical protein